jgi:guanylate kinase
VGKTSVCDELLRRPGFERVITATTRKPRGRERHGVEYLFLSREEFETRAREGGFLEWAEVYGNLYGSPRDHALGILARGRHALLNIDVQGAASVRKSGLPSALVFLLPPAFAVLEARLRKRGTDGEETIRKRIEVARAELERQSEFDVRVVSDTIPQTADDIVAALDRLAP